jgi:hypothetical protein
VWRIGDPALPPRQPPPIPLSEQLRRAALPAFWDAVELTESRRRDSATWEEESHAMAWAEREGRERVARDARAAELVREDAERRRREKGAGGADPEARASAYLLRLSTGANDAWYATLCAVRGFALGEGPGSALVLSEYAPRYHRKLKAGEVRDMARRAMRATKPWGWLLTAGRDGWRR